VTKTKRAPDAAGGKYAALRPAPETPAEPAAAEIEPAETDDELVMLSQQKAYVDHRIAEVLAKRPPRAQPATPRYGRRAQADMVQLGVVIPTALKGRLVSFAHDRDLQLAEATEVLLDLALSANGK
jgi:hypothetical protein